MPGDFIGDGPYQAVTQSPDAAISAGRAFLDLLAGASVYQMDGVGNWAHRYYPELASDQTREMYDALVQLAEACGWKRPE